MEWWVGIILCGVSWNLAPQATFKEGQKFLEAV